jgi:hypothetical protein
MSEPDWPIALFIRRRFFVCPAARERQRHTLSHSHTLAQRTLLSPGPPFPSSSSARIISFTSQIHSLDPLSSVSLRPPPPNRLDPKREPCIRTCRTLPQPSLCPTRRSLTRALHRLRPCLVSPVTTPPIAFTDTTALLSISFFIHCCPRRSGPSLLSLVARERHESRGRCPDHWQNHSERRG